MATQQSSTKKATKPKAPPKTPGPKTVRVTPEVAAQLLGTDKKLLGEVVEITIEQREAERRSEENERRQKEQATNAMAFAVQQMTTPVAQAPTPAVEQYQAELAALQQKFGVQQAPAKGEKVMRNGITRPGANTVTGKVWATADKVTIAQGRPALISEVRLDQDLRGVNDHTIKTQYARWREFNGVKGRIAPAATKVMTHDGNP